MQRPTIVAIESATPKLAISQKEIFDTFFGPLYESIPDARGLVQTTQVRQRHFSWDPREVMAHRVPSTAERMAVWEQVALELSCESTRASLRDTERAKVGCLAVASCTGYSGPTLDVLLSKALELPKTVRRTFVGHMGCYAAFNVIKLALDSLNARPEELAVVNCVELCTLHVRREPTAEQAVIHALFGDASASLVLSSAEEGKGPQIMGTHTLTQYETDEMMTWKMADDGFRMNLSPYVPLVLSESVGGFVDALLLAHGLKRSDVRYWGIHPGGPKIVQAIERALCLRPEQTRSTHRVLAEFGNCSSATILLVLKDMLERESPRLGEYAVFMAFGPGLTMEAFLVRF